MTPNEKRALYEGYLKLDGVDLDEALVQQPQCYYEVCSLLADKRLEKRDKEVSLKKTEGRVDARARKRFDRNNTFFTDATIASIIDCDPTVVKLRKRYNLSCKKVERLEALKEGYVQRSFSLKDLVARVNQTYFMPDGASAPSPKKPRKRKRQVLRSI